MPVLSTTTSVRRFEELIAGHPYLIEVAPVSQDRWRAYIVRIPGVPNAMMPFYGQTPDEAAAQLRQWLTRAYERVATGVRRV
jgi:IS1 family transposase